MQRKIALEILWGPYLVSGIVNRPTVTMPAFAPQHVYSPHHFDIKRNRNGYWIARDRDGLVGGTFLTRKAALRFALFETDGDSAYVHPDPEPRPIRLDDQRARRHTRQSS